MAVDPQAQIWFLWTGAGQAGPYSATQLAAMLANGSISHEHSLWRDGYANWFRIADIPEFNEPVRPTPASEEAFVPCAEVRPQSAAARPAAAFSPRPAGAEPPRASSTLSERLPLRILIPLLLLGCGAWFAWPHLYPSLACQKAEEFSGYVLNGFFDRADPMATGQAREYSLEARRNEEMTAEIAGVVYGYWQTFESEAKSGQGSTVTFLEGVERMPKRGGATRTVHFRVTVSVRPENGQWKAERYAREGVDAVGWLHKLRRITSFKKGSMK